MTVEVLTLMMHGLSYTWGWQLLSAERCWQVVFWRSHSLCQL